MRYRAALVSGLLLVLSLPVSAQGPIQTAVAAQYGCCEHDRDHDHHDRDHERGMRSPVKFWVGLGLIAAGTTLSVAAVTWARETDLPDGARLNITHAPCRTDSVLTRLQIADCKVNQPLLWIGTGLNAAGVLLVIGGGRGHPSVGIGARQVALRVQF